MSVLTSLGVLFYDDEKFTRMIKMNEKWCTQAWVLWKELAKYYKVVPETVRQRAIVLGLYKINVQAPCFRKPK